MQDFLSERIFGESVENLLIFFGIPLVMLLMRRLISKGIAHIVYRFFRKLTKDSRILDFDRLIVRPLGWLIFNLGLLIYFKLVISGRLDEAISISQSLQFWHKTLLVLISINVIVLLVKSIEFGSIILLEKAALTESQEDDQIILFTKDILKVLVWVAGIFFVLSNILGIDITSLLAGAGIAGLAVAFAAKDSLENLFGSFTIFIEKPFKMGDFVQVGEVVGTIEKVGFRSTRVRTLDKTFVTLPNNKIVSTHSENMTERTFRRVKDFVGVTYNTSKEQIEGIVRDIQEYLDQHEHTTKDGIVGLHDFGDSSINILVQYYITELNWNLYIKIKEEINFKIMEIVAQHKTGFAFPSRSIYIEKND